MGGAGRACRGLACLCATDELSRLNDLDMARALSVGDFITPRYEAERQRATRLCVKVALRPSEAEHRGHIENKYVTVVTLLWYGSRMSPT